MLPGFPIPLLNRQLTLEATPSLPNMTSDTSPSGLITYSSQNDDGSFAAWQAFDNSIFSRWGSAYGAGFPQWIQRQTPAPITVGRLALGYTDNVIGGSGPKDFTFLGSNDGSNWTQLLSVTGEAWSGGYTVKLYDVLNPAAFNRHRLVVGSVPSPSGLVLIYSLAFYQLL